MNISLEKVTSVSAELTINLVKADYEAQVEKEIKDFAHKAQMPGFRKGKVPMALIKKSYGTQAKSDVVNRMLSDAIDNYLRENKTNILGELIGSEKQQPQDIEAQDDFTFIFDIALAPEFNIELTSDDHIDYFDIEVTDDMVTKQLDALRQQAGHPENVEAYVDRDIVRGTLVELDEEDHAKEGGIVIEQSSIMPVYFKNEDEKKLFEGAQKNTIIVFSPAKAYEGSDSEIAALLKIGKEEVPAHMGKFSFQIEEISRFVAAELDQDFFDKTFGEDSVKNEEEARAKVMENIAALQVNDSNYKFLLDLRTYAEDKVGELEFPNELLKKIMVMRNQKAENPEEEVEKHFAEAIKDLKWHLIKEQLVAAKGIKVEEADVKAAAIQSARFQFMQYGMSNIPGEYLEQMAENMLKDRNQANSLVDTCVNNKIAATYKEVVTLNHKSISAEDFGKMFE